ncbi:hypothetical protein VMUT_2329 [Vulcanisaeta moutnovskia 768-28]|uniref:Uncharacterized protein n=2 Tax=Vulcanisaeta TaxID=164450 RepID=F0QY35_VULM7|nr:hypothetical protein VMUT_2329 [Vulcanisaeta moutnovskia 768-28]
MKLNNYISYILISIIWLILELTLTQYAQCSSTAFLSILVNAISMVVVSYRSTYHKYLFVINIVLLTYMGFLIPEALVIPYTVILMVSIVLYSSLIGILKFYPILLSLFIIYLSYIVERVIIKLPILNGFKSLIESAGINVGLFIVVFTWYFSLFIISIVIILLIIFLGKKVMIYSNIY